MKTNLFHILVSVIHIFGYRYILNIPIVLKQKINMHRFTMSCELSKIYKNFNIFIAFSISYILIFIAIIHSCLENSNSRMVDNICIFCVIAYVKILAYYGFAPLDANFVALNIMNMKIQSSIQAYFLVQAPRILLFFFQKKSHGTFIKLYTI